MQPRGGWLAWVEDVTDYYQANNASPFAWTVWVPGSAGSAAPKFSVSVSDAPGAAVNDYAPTGWHAGTTTRLLATANAGDTSITGFDATGVYDGACIYVHNPSATDLLKIQHLNAGSLLANRVRCPGFAEYDVVPGGGFLLIRVGALWTIR
jgi:hypothetical protein